MGTACAAAFALAVTDKGYSCVLRNLIMISFRVRSISPVCCLLAWCTRSSCGLEFPRSELRLPRFRLSTAVHYGLTDNTQKLTIANGQMDKWTNGKSTNENRKFKNPSTMLHSQIESSLKHAVY